MHLVPRNLFDRTVSPGLNEAIAGFETAGYAKSEPEPRYNVVLEKHRVT